MTSLVQQACGAVVPYAYKQAKTCYTYIKHYHSNIKELHSTVDHLRRHKDVIEKKVQNGVEKGQHITKVASKWLQEVDQLLKDEELTKLIEMDEGNRTLLERDKCCFGIVEKLSHRYKISKAAHKKIKDIKEHIQAPKGLPDPVTLPASKEEVKDVLNYYKSMGLYSREELMKKLVENLEDDQVDAVGLFGMKAVGKSTLAKEITTRRAKYMFDKIVLVEISNAFQVSKIERIQEQIAKQLNLSLHHVHNTKQRARKLYTELISQLKSKGKEEVSKILIIIDNIGEEFDLDEVGIPYGRTKDLRCNLLLISRHKENIPQLPNISIFEMCPLLEDETRCLFWTRVEEIVDMNSDYIYVGHRLLKKCRGLPLPVVVLANVLRGKGLSMWRHCSDKAEYPTSTNVPDMPPETTSILEICCDLMDLGKEKKMFLLLACLYPLGTSVPIKELMRYGTGLGWFQHVSNLTQAMEVARKWADDLKSLSLLLEDDSDGCVKICDVVRTFTISFAKKDRLNFVDIEANFGWIEWKDQTAISLVPGRDHSHLDGMKSSMLQILLLKGSQLSKLSIYYFEGMTNLKVLVLTHMNFEHGLPESIVTLQGLTTLSLEHCNLGDIELVCKLTDLRVLTLSQSSLEKLPDGMRNLKNLRLLDLDGCFIRQSCQANIIASLSILEGLYMFGSSEKRMVTAASLHELKFLRQLNALEMHVLDIQQLPTDNQFVKNLGKFRISIGGLSYERAKGLTYSRVLEIAEVGEKELLKYSCVKSLLKKADCLELRYIKGLKHLVHDFDAESFRNMKFLRVESCSNIECIVNCHVSENDIIPFSDLEYLELHNLSHLTEIMTSDNGAPAAMFNKLQHLSLEFLPRIRYYALPVCSAPVNLIDMYVGQCDNLKYIFMEQASAKWNREAHVTEETDLIKLPYLKVLKLYALPKLESVLGQGRQVCKALFNKKIIFSSLELLELEGLHSIEKLWDLPLFQDMFTTFSAFVLRHESSKQLHLSALRSLKVIQIDFCEGLQNIGSPSIASAFVHLERLSISLSAKMGEIIGRETNQDEIYEKVIVFPNLKYLYLSQLGNLNSFYPGSYELKFLALKVLKLKWLRSMNKFAGSETSSAFFPGKIKLPCLEELVVEEVNDEVNDLWESSYMHNMDNNGTIATSDTSPRLRKLTLTNTKSLKIIPSTVSQHLSFLKLTKIHDGTKVLLTTSVSSTKDGSIWTYSHLPKLEEMVIEGFNSLEDLFENQTAMSGLNEDDNIIPSATSTFCEQLKRLELSNLPKLNLIPLHLFSNLYYLSIDSVSWKHVFSMDLIVGKLTRLEDLVISRCGKMQVVLKYEYGGDNVKDEVIVFPKLKRIRLEYLLHLHSFISGSYIKFHFPSLEQVDVRYCNEIQFFSPGDFIAPNLEKVESHQCPRLQPSFSRRLTTLKSLYLEQEKVK